MYTIIAGTNRIGSNTKKVALEYSRILTEKGIEHQFLSLDNEDVTKKSDAFLQLEERILMPTQKFIFILPEYNGSFPGIFKLMIDNSDVKKCWWNKKVLLTGVASGRAGNLRGLEHITGSLLHMKMTVHPNRLPISMVDKLLNEDGNITDEGTLKTISIQLDEFINY